MRSRPVLSTLPVFLLAGALVLATAPAVSADPLPTGVFLIKDVKNNLCASPTVQRSPDGDNFVIGISCNSADVVQWSYDAKTKQVASRRKDAEFKNTCMAWDARRRMIVKKCDASDSAQRWDRHTEEINKYYHDSRTFLKVALLNGEYVPSVARGAGSRLTWDVSHKENFGPQDATAMEFVPVKA